MNIDLLSLAVITGLTYEEVAKMLVGASGSTVVLDITRDDAGMSETGILEDQFRKENKIHTVLNLNIFRDVEEIDLRSAEFLSQMLEVMIGVKLCKLSNM